MCCISLLINECSSIEDVWKDSFPEDDIVGGECQLEIPIDDILSFD